MQPALVTPPDISEPISLTPPPSRDFPKTCLLRGRVLSAHDRASAVHHARITLWDREVQCQKDGTFTLNLDALPSQFVLEIEAEGYHPYREIFHPGVIDRGTGLSRDFFLIPLTAKSVSLIVRSSPVVPLSDNDDTDEFDLEELLPEELLDDDLLDDDLVAEDLLEDCELLTDVVNDEKTAQTAEAVDTPELILDCQELKEELDAVADDLYLTIEDARRLSTSRLNSQSNNLP